ncbi:MAG: hypothetical protein ACFB2X_16670, partial [Rivularia sp. (in: cyanobacteria)]
AVHSPSYYLKNQSVYKQRHGNKAGRISTPLFASIKWEENLHHFLPPLRGKCAGCGHSYK